MAKKNVSDWDFKAINPLNYELEIVLPGIKNRLMRMVFDKVMKRMNVKKDSKGLYESEGCDRNGKLQWKDLKTFSIPAEDLVKFEKLLMTCVHKQLIDIKNTIKNDGVYIASESLSKCTYEKNVDNDWLVRILISGDYYRKAK